MRKPLAFFSLFDNFVIDTPKCLRVDLVQNQYRGRRRCIFTILCALPGDNEPCDGLIMVECVGLEIFLWRRLLVWVVQKVLKGEGAQFEEVK